MRSFFRALDRDGVRALLISGQATVLYGASTFSEDVDLWVDPRPENWRCLQTALASVDARFYKLTPALDLRFAKRGHGFHFTLPESVASPDLVFLDVLGIPPRVGSFAECFRRARPFATAWGTVSVVHPRDLAEIKKTRRLADYTVISALARIHGLATRERREWAWGLENAFQPEDFLSLWDGGKNEWQRGWLRRHPRLARILGSRDDRARDQGLSVEFGRRIEKLRQRDRDYWAPIVAELKRLQRDGELVPEGTLVPRAA